MSYDRKMFPWLDLTDRKFGASAVSSSGHRHIASGVQRDSITQVPCYTNLSKTPPGILDYVGFKPEVFGVRCATQFRYFVYTN